MIFTEIPLQDSINKPQLVKRGFCFSPFIEVRALHQNCLAFKSKASGWYFYYWDSKSRNLLPKVRIVLYQIKCQIYCGEFQTRLDIKYIEIPTDRWKNGKGCSSQAVILGKKMLYTCNWTVVRSYCKAIEILCCIQN